MKNQFRAPPCLLNEDGSSEDSVCINHLKSLFVKKFKNVQRTIINHGMGTHDTKEDMRVKIGKFQTEIIELKNLKIKLKMTERSQEQNKSYRGQVQ